jgi:hypothetical protein
MKNERRDYSLFDSAEIIECIASSLLDKLDANPKASTQTERIRARRHLEKIHGDAELIAKVASRLLERFSDL